MIEFSIIMPALNEEDNIEQAINNILLAFDVANIKGEIIVIDDGSVDNTSAIVKEKYPNIVKIISHNSTRGIGASFWSGVIEARGGFVCMIPGDNENNPHEIIKCIKMLDKVDMVIPFPIDRWTRSFTRSFISILFTIIINITFKVNLYYTNGTIIYKKSVLQKLKHKSKGYFYQTDILIRLLKRGYSYCEVPYHIKNQINRKSKALSFSNLGQVIKDYLRLIVDIYLKGAQNK